MPSGTSLYKQLDRSMPLAPLAIVALPSAQDLGVKTISHIPDEVDLIAPAILKPILEIKNKTSNFEESYLKLGEVLIALSICSTTNPVVKKVLENLDKLRDTELHSTHLISDDELVILSNLGVNATCGTDIDFS